MPVGFFSPSFTACCRRTRTSDEMSVRDGLGDAIPDELEATVPTPSSLAAPSRRPVGYTHVRLCTRMHVRTSMGPSRRWPVRCSLPAPPFAATEPCFGFVPDGTCFMQLLVATRRRPFPRLPARRSSQRTSIGRQHHGPVLDGQLHVRAPCAAAAISSRRPRQGHLGCRRQQVRGSANLVEEEKGIGSGEERIEEEEDKREEIKVACGPIPSVRVADEPG